MEITLSIADILQNLIERLPAAASLFLSLCVVAFGFWLKFKKSGTDNKVSENNIQIAQVESLMKQINLLSSELDRTRKQLTELHEQNIELMSELREANRRISELEFTLEQRDLTLHRPTPL